MKGEDLKLIYLPLVFLMINQSLQAKELSWSEAIALAQSQNSDLKAAQLNLRSFEESVAIARAAFLPIVSANLRADQNQGSAQGAPVTQSYGASLSANTQLFAGGANLARLTEAELQVKIARENLRVTKARVSHDLKTSFQGLIYAQKWREMAASIAARREDNKRIVELRFEGGRENKGSVLISRANFEQARLNLLEAELMIESSRASLARVLGLDNSVDLKAREPGPQVTDPPQSPSLRDLASQSPEIRSLELQKQIAEQSLQIAKSSHYPRLGLEGVIGRTDDQFFPQSRDSWRASLVLQIPIYSGGRHLASTKSTSLRLASSTESLAHRYRDLESRLQDALMNYKLAHQRALVNQMHREAAEIRAEIARNRYNNGLMSFEDWDVVESDLINRQRNDLFSIQSKIQTEARWEQLLGKGVLE